MGGLFGVASQTDCVMDLFFGTDYHSHLGTKKGGLAVDQKTGIKRIIHNIENSPFRTKFETDVTKLAGRLGIGCISDSDSQPLYVHSHLGEYAIATVGKLDNIDELIGLVFQKRTTHFVELSGGEINSTELTAILIDRCDTFEDGIRYVWEKIRGSLSILILTKEKIIAARDRYGRTPLIVGKKKDGCCVSFESFAYFNLGYQTAHIIGPGEIIHMTPEGFETVVPPSDSLKICAFLWVYYGYPCSDYEGISVETVRYAGGGRLARRDREADICAPDYIAGIPDSWNGLRHRIQQRIGHSVCAAVYKIHADVAAQLYAARSADTQFNRKNEADSRSLSHKREKTALLRRFNRSRHPTAGNRRFSL